MRHYSGVKKVGSNCKVGHIEFGRIVNFEVGYPERHHYICGGMSLREHILYLFTGVNIPFRHVIFTHSGFKVFRHTLFCGSALSDKLHDFKRHAGFKPMVQKVYHNIVTQSYNFRQGCGFILDKVLRVVKPNISTVGKSGYYKQFHKGCRHSVNQHSADKVGSKFRNAKGSYLTVNLFGFDAKSLSAAEQTHCFFIVKRNLQGVYTCQILQHSYC